MSPEDSIDRPHPHVGGLYRTRLCKFGKSCQYGDRCFYAHSQEQIRPRDGSASSTPACTVSDSVHRSSRRSSAVLSEINHEISGFMAESVCGSSHRFCASAEVGENSYGLGLPSPSMCVIGPIIANLCDISRSSYESIRDSSAAGSMSPLSVASSAAPEESTMYSYCYFYIQYMLGAYRPDDLAQLLKQAAPAYYTD